jgi:hypothetical protein
MPIEKKSVGNRSVDVLHAAVLAKRQALAILLQSLGALLGLFARLQALGCGLVGLGHGPMAGNVLLNFFVAVLGQSPPRHTHGGKKKGNFVHGFLGNRMVGLEVTSFRSGVDPHREGYCHARTRRANVFLNFTTLGAATAMQ